MAVTPLPLGIQQARRAWRRQAAGSRGLALLAMEVEAPAASVGGPAAVQPQGMGELMPESNSLRMLSTC